MSKRRTLLASEIRSFETDVVDDEEEKRRRISERFETPNLASKGQRKNPGSRSNNLKENELQNRNSVANKTATSGVGNATMQQPVAKPSNEALSCLYHNCVKLLNENKINVKNAFQLKLIDYMSDIVLNEEIVGGVTNFQTVGCTIDVGTKIYAARVDALHQNTYQVLSGLGHSGADDEEANGNLNNEKNDSENNQTNFVDENDEEDPKNKRNKAKKRRAKKSQIAENIETITSKMRDEFKDEDLYFSKISTCIENEAIAGILMNKLHVQNDSGRILINADEIKYDRTIKFSLNDAECDFKPLIDYYLTNSIDLKNLKLCNELNTFKFIGWNLETNDEISKLVESMNAADDHLEAHRFDANNLQLSRLNMSGLNAPAIDADLDMDDFCNDMGGGCEMDNMDVESHMNSSKLAAMSQHNSAIVFDKIDDLRSLNSVADLTTLISQTPSDYSYFNFEKLKLQNLPRHLKEMAVKLVSSRNNTNENLNASTTSSQKTATVRNKRQAPRIDLNQNQDLSKFLKITKKAIYLCDRTIEKRSEKPSRLETERQFDYNSKELFQAYFKSAPAKILSDVDMVENLLINDDDLDVLNKKKTNSTNPNAFNNEDDDDGHLGGMDDDAFEIPCTAQTNEPAFYSQHGGEFMQSQQIDHPMLMQVNENDNTLMQNTNGELKRFDGENLIEAPLQVNALNIEYAKTSKNIDVRRLKQTIWNLLISQQEKENKNDIENSIGNDENNSLLKNKNTEFSINASLKSIYKQLVPPLVTQRVYDDLTICIVFQMLLFLANEHNLILKNDLIGSDVIITNY